MNQGWNFTVYDRLGSLIVKRPDGTETEMPIARLGKSEGVALFWEMAKALTDLTLWRPIEEAPEWTFVLVIDDGEITIAQRQGEFGWHDEEPRRLRHAPSAWMPLPPLPSPD